MTFGEALAAEIAAHAETQCEAATRTGLSQTAISQMMRNVRTPSIITAAKLMAAYPRLFMWYGTQIFGKPGTE